MMYSSFAAPPSAIPSQRERTEWAGFYSLDFQADE